jgi:hypothetical protein
MSGYNALKYATVAAFLVFANSSLKIHSTIRRYRTYPVERG